MSISFRVLDSIEVTSDDKPVTELRRRERHLLAILALHANRPVAADRLVDLLWQEDPPATARRLLQGHVARLRSLLRAHGGAGDEIDVSRQSGGYLLQCAEERIDAFRFRALVDRARAAEPGPERVALLGQALRMWPADSADAGSEFHRRLYGELSQMRATAREDWIVGSLRLGRHRELIPELDRLTTADPVDERLAELYLEALHLGGRRTEALHVYQRVRTALADELGLDPGPALVERYRAILQTTPAAPAGTGPWSRPDRDEPVPAELPARPTFFVGRDAESARLDAAAAADGPRTVVLTGPAGIGKTALALDWAHRNAAGFANGRLFVNLRGYGRDAPVDPAAVLERFLADLGVRTTGQPSLQDLTARYRSLLATRRILVVVDDAGSTEQIRPFLPGGGRSLVLVTTRRRPDSLVATDGATVVAVPPLGRRAAADLIRNVAAGGAGPVPEPDIDRLADLCDRFPLALRIAGVRLAAPEQSPDALIRELGDENRRLRLLTTLDGELAVHAATAATYRRLDPAARRMFRALGLHPGPRPVTAACAALSGLPLPQARTALTRLANHNLAVPDGQDRYVVYDLVRLYARAQGRAEDPVAARHDAEANLLDWYIATARAADAVLRPLVRPVDGAADPRPPGVVRIAAADAALAWFDTVADGLTGALYQWWDRHPHRCWSLAIHLGGWLERRASFTTWVTVMRTAVKAASRHGSPAGRAAALNGLAVAHSQRGQLTAATPLYERAIQLWNELGEHERAAYTSMQLGCLNAEAGDSDVAIALLERALRTLAALPGAEPKANTARFNLGFAYRRAGRLYDAIALYEQVLDQAMVDEDYRLVCNAHLNLGTAYRVDGAYPTALDHCRNGLELARKLRDRTYEAWALHLLGDIHADAADIEAARAGWAQALRIYDWQASPKAAEVRKLLAG